MRKTMQTALALILASTLATAAVAQTNTGVAADAGKTTTADTGNAYAGGDSPDMPADKVVEMLNMADGAMVGTKIGEVASIKDVSVVKLSDLSAAQNIDIDMLNKALADQAPMLASLKTSIAGSAVVGDALAAKGFNANQVVAASAAEDSMAVTVVVDDR